MTAALLRWWTVPRLNSHSNPSSTGESSTAKKVLVDKVMISFIQNELVLLLPFIGTSLDLELSKKIKDGGKC